MSADRAFGGPLQGQIDRLSPPRSVRVVVTGGVAVVLLASVLVVATVAGPASASDPVQAERETVDGPGRGPGADDPMTRARLLSVVVPSVCGLPRARLVGGVHPVAPRPYGPWAAIVGYRPWADNERPETHIGDIIRDDVADGLIILACSPGGNGYFEKALAYRSDGHFLGAVPVLRHIPPSPYAIGFDHDWTAIIGQAIRLRVHSFGPYDAHCCPSVVTGLRFRWVDGRFRLIRST